MRVNRSASWRVLFVGLLTFGFIGAFVVAAAGQPRDPLVMSVWEPGGLQDDSLATIISLVGEADAEYSVFHSGTIRLSSVTRQSEDIQRAPEGLHYPMATIAADPDASRALIGVRAAEALARGEVVMGATSARMRGAEAGDDITFLGWDGVEHEATIGFVAPDHKMDSGELLFSLEDAAGFEFDRPSSVKVWNVADHGALESALVQVFDDRLMGISLSSDPPDPDSVTPSAQLKERFGEFAYRPTGNGDEIEIEPAWLEANIVTVDLPILGVFKCHRMVVPYLEAAVDDIMRGGLTGQIDPEDFQLAGGCFNSRMIRGGDKGGALSRHAWGAAIDINPSTNPYGGAITMDRQVAEVFHYWGFAWGGGWVFSDGAHFEWKHLPYHVVKA